MALQARRLVASRAALLLKKRARVDFVPAIGTGRVLEHHDLPLPLRFVEQSSLEPDHCIGLQSKLSQIECAAAPAKILSRRLALRITHSDQSTSAAAQKGRDRAPRDVVHGRAKKRYRLSVAARRRRIAITAPRSHRSPQQTLSRRQNTKHT